MDPSDNFFTSVSSEPAINIWSTSSGRLVRTYPTPPNSNMTQSKNTIQTDCAGTHLALTVGSHVSLLDFYSGEIKSNTRQDVSVNGCCFSEDGKRLFIVLRSGVLCWFKLSSEVVRTIKERKKEIAVIKQADENVSHNTIQSDNTPKHKEDVVEAAPVVIPASPPVAEPPVRQLSLAREREIMKLDDTKWYYCILKVGFCIS